MRRRNDDAASGSLSVLQVCAPADVGGLERVVQQLSQGLVKRGHEVTTVAVVEAGANTGPFLDPMTSAGVRTIALEIPARAYLRERRAVSSLLGELAPDVLHTHGYRPDVLHGAAARRRGIASVSTLHGSSRMGGLSHFFEWVQERILPEFDGVVAVSRPLSRMLERRGMSPERLHSIPNSWRPSHRALSRSEARAQLHLPAGDVRIIGWVGRLVKVKGADVFIRALAELGSEPWIACVIGDGPERYAAELLAQEFGIASRILFSGAIHDAADLFSAFDLFVLSSRSEGCPIVLFEAMASATPVVATEVGGIPDVLDGSRDGWLVPSESPTALAGAIRLALSDPAGAMVRAGNARDRAWRDFGPDAWIGRYEQAYRSAIRVRRFRS